MASGKFLPSITQVPNKLSSTWRYPTPGYRPPQQTEVQLANTRRPCGCGADALKCPDGYEHFQCLTKTSLRGPWGVTEQFSCAIFALR